MEQETRNMGKKIKQRRQGANTFLVSCFLLLVATPVFAAKISFDTKTNEMAVGQQFQVDLMLDAEGENINAIEGKITFSKELLEIKEISDGDSIINLWVERPRQGQETRDKRQGEVIFSGIIPAGFAGVLSPYYEGGRPGKIFSLIFTSKGEGEGTVNLENGKVLLHDGLGTPAKLGIFNFEFRILKREVRIPDSGFLIPEDKDSPEDFKPEIASSQNVFDGKYFLVFAAQDKGSGIDHFEIKETRNKRQGKKWIEAESTYVLKDQKLKSYIYVKAVDKAGNERIAVVEPRYLIRWYEFPLAWIIIAIAGIIAYLIWRKLKNKR